MRLSRLFYLYVKNAQNRMTRIRTIDKIIIGVPFDIVDNGGNQIRYH